MTPLTPEALPDGWSEGVATALSLLTAVSANLAPPSILLPWTVLRRAINDALNSRFLEVVPDGPVPWPCEAQSAAMVEFRLPTAGAAGADTTSSGGGVDTAKQPLPAFGEPTQATVEAPVAAARLDSAGLVALADALADVQAAVAAFGTPLTFRVTVEAPGLPPAARQALCDELVKVTGEFAAAG